LIARTNGVALVAVPRVSVSRTWNSLHAIPPANSSTAGKVLAAVSVVAARRRARDDLVPSDVAPVFSPTVPPSLIAVDLDVEPRLLTLTARR
jgi:hypothetical protein